MWDFKIDPPEDGYGHRQLEEWAAMSMNARNAYLERMAAAYLKLTGLRADEVVLVEQRMSTGVSHFFAKRVDVERFISLKADEPPPVAADAGCVAEVYESTGQCVEEPVQYFNGGEPWQEESPRFVGLGSDHLPIADVFSPASVDLPLEVDDNRDGYEGEIGVYAAGDDDPLVITGDMEDCGWESIALAHLFAAAPELYEVTRKNQGKHREMEMFLRDRLNRWWNSAGYTTGMLLSDLDEIREMLGNIDLEEEAALRKASPYGHNGPASRWVDPESPEAGYRQFDKDLDEIRELVSSALASGLEGQRHAVRTVVDLLNSQTPDLRRAFMETMTGDVSEHLLAMATDAGVTINGPWQGQWYEPKGSEISAPATALREVQPGLWMGGPWDEMEERTFPKEPYYTQTAPGYAPYSPEWWAAVHRGEHPTWHAPEGEDYDPRPTITPATIEDELRFFPGDIAGLIRRMPSEGVQRAAIARWKHYVQTEEEPEELFRRYAEGVNLGTRLATSLFGSLWNALGQPERSGKVEAGVQVGKDPSVDLRQSGMPPTTDHRGVDFQLFADGMASTDLGGGTVGDVIDGEKFTEGGFGWDGPAMMPTTWDMLQSNFRQRWGYTPVWHDLVGLGVREMQLRDMWKAIALAYQYPIELDVVISFHRTFGFLPKTTYPAWSAEVYDTETFRRSCLSHNRRSLTDIIVTRQRQTS